jgi:hypothetical protein
VCGGTAEAGQKQDDLQRALEELTEVLREALKTRPEGAGTAAVPGQQKRGFGDVRSMVDKAMSATRAGGGGGAADTLKMAMDIIKMIVK